MDSVIQLCKLTRYAAACVGILCCSACRTPDVHRETADRHAYRNIQEAREEAGLKPAEFSIEPPAETL